MSCCGNLAWATDSPRRKNVPLPTCRCSIGLFRRQPEWNSRIQDLHRTRAHQFRLGPAASDTELIENICENEKDVDNMVGK